MFVMLLCFLFFATDQINRLLAQVFSSEFPKIFKNTFCFATFLKSHFGMGWRRSSVFIVNFEHISYLFLVFLLLTLNM